MTLKTQILIYPESSFHTIDEWERIAAEFLELQRLGVDTRGGTIVDNPKIALLINKYFGFQLKTELARLSPIITRKNILDFIEDFVNHKAWGLRKEFSTYFPNIDSIKIAYFYSRYDIEPYVLLDKQFTQTLYGSTEHDIEVFRFTTMDNLKKLELLISHNTAFDISTFTKQWKTFFRKESNVLVKLRGNLVAAFRSDVKSIPTDKGNKAANMERMAYPGIQDNLCLSLDDCTGAHTSLWNELIVKPTKIISYKQINTY
jgi:hypothetical protein